MALRQQKYVGGLRSEIMETLSVALNKRLIRELSITTTDKIFDINTPIFFTQFPLWWLRIRI
jgi:hypothetical protein